MIYKKPIPKFPRKMECCYLGWVKAIGYKILQRRYPLLPNFICWHRLSFKVTCFSGLSCKSIKILDFEAVLMLSSSAGGSSLEVCGLLIQNRLPGQFLNVTPIISAVGHGRRVTQFAILSSDLRAPLLRVFCGNLLYRINNIN